MAGAVTGLHVFAADAGPEALSLLDGNFSPLAAVINTLVTYSNYYVDSGAVNALAVTVSAPQVVSYADGLILEVTVANTTTSATPTLAVNGLGTRTIVHNDNSSLVVGELIAGQRILVIYDATNNVWRLLSATYVATFNATVTINAVAGKQSLVVNGAANQFAEQILGSSTAGQSWGLNVAAGTNSADFAFQVVNQAQTGQFMRIYGDGHGNLGPSITNSLSWNANADFTINAASGSPLTAQVAGTSIFVANGITTPTVQGYGPTAAALVDMTPDKGSWTTTLSGPYTSNPSGTLKWERQGTQVTIWCDANILGTATTSGQPITASGLPAAITPSSSRIVVCGGALEDNGTAGILGEVSVNSGGSMTIQLMKTATGANPVNVVGTGTFTGSGTTGILANWSITYSL